MSALPPRFSVLSSSTADHLSPTNSYTRFSLPSAPSSASATAAAGTQKPSSRPNIYDRPLNKTRTAEVSASAFAFLFSEVVQYMQKRVSGIDGLERRCAQTITLTPIISGLTMSRSLNTLGYRIGTRVLELMAWRAESTSKAPKRDVRFLPVLMSIHTNVWKAVFGKPADAIEKSVQNEDECVGSSDTC
jgi:hypothetical protein